MLYLTIQLQLHLAENALYLEVDFVSLATNVNRVDEDEHENGRIRERIDRELLKLRRDLLLK